MLRLLRRLEVIFRKIRVVDEHVGISADGTDRLWPNEKAGTCNRCSLGSNPWVDSKNCLWVGGGSDLYNQMATKHNTQKPRKHSPRITTSIVWQKPTAPLPALLIQICRSVNRNSLPHFFFPSSSFSTNWRASTLTLSHCLQRYFTLEYLPKCMFWHVICGFSFRWCWASHTSFWRVSFQVFYPFCDSDAKHGNPSETISPRSIHLSTCG